MKSVSEQEWIKKAEGLAEWRKNRTSPPNLDLYKRIVSMVHVGLNVADIGAGQCHLFSCLQENDHVYYPFDPFPLNDGITRLCAEDFAEDFNEDDMGRYHTVFMLSALDNVVDLKLALKGLRNAATENIVILTSIGVLPDPAHTVQVDRSDLVSILGEPFQEVEMLPKVFLFEWRVK